jgi:hypothetical protein
MTIDPGLNPGRRGGKPTTNRRSYGAAYLSIYPSIYLSTSIYLWLYSPRGPWPLFQFLNLYTIGRTPWTRNQPFARPLPIHRTTQTQNKRITTSMSRLEFEPTIPVFERAKMVHVLDRVTTVIDVARTTPYANAVVDIRQLSLNNP